MPSYVELNKNLNFPASSAPSKIILGINSTGSAVLVDNNGDITTIGSGGSGIFIPQPIVSFTGATEVTAQQGVYVQFPDTGFDFNNGNPELFLFRWKKSNKSNRGFDTEKRRRPSRWVHPTTHDSATKWAGWKFFNGQQYYRGSDIEITGRTTEWAIPATIKPYEKFGVDFNKYMFWNITSGATTIANPQFDVNVFSLGTFGPSTHFEGDFPDRKHINIGMSKRGNGANIIKYAFAVAVDNPLATKTNGLCPKIFGPLSEPFYSIIHKASTYGDITLIKEAHLVHKHVYKGNTAPTA